MTRKPQPTLSCRRRSARGWSAERSRRTGRAEQGGQEAADGDTRASGGSRIHRATSDRGTSGGGASISFSTLDGSRGRLVAGRFPRKNAWRTCHADNSVSHWEDMPASGAGLPRPERRSEMPAATVVFRRIFPIILSGFRIVHPVRYCKWRRSRRAGARSRRLSEIAASRSPAFVWRSESGWQRRKWDGSAAGRFAWHRAGRDRVRCWRRPSGPAADRRRRRRRRRRSRPWSRFLSLRHSRRASSDAAHASAACRRS